MRQSGELREAVQRERQRLGVSRRRSEAPVVLGKRVIQENLINDQRRTVLFRHARDLLMFLPLEKGAGRVVGIHDDNGLRSFSALAIDIEAPLAVIVAEMVMAKLHVIDLREIIEERIRRPGNKDAFARVAEELEDQRIGLAGAGGEEDVGRVNADTLLPVVVANSFARREKPSRLRPVAQRLRVGERGEQLPLRVVDPKLCRVGDCEVKDRPARCPPSLQQFGEPVRLTIPIGALRKHSKRSEGNRHGATVPVNESLK